MKIVVISDSHGDFAALKRVVAKEEPFELLIHLGDGLEDGFRLRRIKEFNLDGVNGNNDPGDLFPEKLILKLGGKICFFSHGDQYQVHNGLDLLWQAAGGEKADLVFYGHTHRFEDRVFKGKRFFNPGTICSYLNREPSYLLLEVGPAELNVEKRLL
ncbi:MAG: metallophosphoesterase family protein [Bacillota bacterium]